MSEVESHRDSASTDANGVGITPKLFASGSLPLPFDVRCRARMSAFGFSPAGTALSLLLERFHVVIHSDQHLATQVAKLPSNRSSFRLGARRLTEHCHLYIQVS